MIRRDITTRPKDAPERAVLGHTEAAAAAIICILLLAASLDHLVSMVRQMRYTDPIWIGFWGILSLALLVLLARAVLGATVVRRHDGQLTISVSVGPLVLWDVKSVPLTELEHLVIEKRVHGYKGKKMHRYVILYGRAGTQRELLGFLSRENARLLVTGVLRGLFDKEPII